MRDAQAAKEQGKKLNESSRDLREQAQRMLEEATPQQRRELEQLARDLAHEQGTPNSGIPGGDGAIGDGAGEGGVRGPTLPVREPARAPGEELQRVPVDARDRGARPRERTIAEMMRDPREVQGTSGRSTGEGVEGLREAVEGAQRGIESQSVPAQRSELVRRVFERYRTRVQPAGTPTAQPAPIRSTDAAPAAPSSSGGTSGAPK